MSGLFCNSIVDIKVLTNLKILSLNNQKIKYIPLISAHIRARYTDLDCICGLNINSDNFIEKYPMSNIKTANDCKKFCKFKCSYRVGKFL